MKGHFAVVKLLVKADPSALDVCDTTGSTALHCAARFGHAAIVAYLAQRGASLNIPMWASGATALHLAALQNHIDVVQVLCECGASILVRDAEGRTPLDTARAEEHNAIASYLWKRGNGEVTPALTCLPQ